MKVKGLDGKEYTLKLTRKEESDAKSQLHLKCRNILKEVFPGEHFFEEVYVAGCTTKLFIDFFCPKRKLAVEVQGKQHFIFSLRMHGSIKKFAESKVRDQEKWAWCNLNNISLLQLSYAESEHEWRYKVIKCAGAISPS